MGCLVHVFIMLFQTVAPTKYKSKLTQLEQSNTFRNVIGLTFFNSVGGLIMMVTNVKIANVLGASVYGLYSYYLAIGEVGQNFVRYGRNKTMTRDLIQNPQKFNSLIANTFVLGIMNIALFLIVTHAFSKQLDVSFTLTTMLLLIAPCLGSIDFQPVYESLKQMSWHSVYQLIQRFIYLIAIWVCIVFADGLTMLYLGLTLFVSWLLVLVMQYKEIITDMSIKIKHEVSMKSILLLYKSNFLIALSCMAGVAFGPIIRMVLKDYADAQAVGIYSAGMQIFLISQFLMHQVSRVGNPMMAEAGKEGTDVIIRKRLCKKYVIIMMCAVMPFVLPLCLCPKFLVSILFTDEYQLLSNYMPLFGLYLVALALGIVYTQFLISMRKDKVYFTIYIASAVGTALTAFCVIPSLGLLGAMVSLCVPHSLGCFFYYLCSLKYLR